MAHNNKESIKRMRDDMMYRFNINNTGILWLVVSLHHKHCILLIATGVCLLIYLSHFLLPILPDIYLTVTNKQHYHKYQCQYLQTSNLSQTSSNPSFPIDIVILYAGDNDKSNHELKYVLRSIYQFLPWHNHIFIVTPIIDQYHKYPKFINTSFDKLTKYITMIDQSILFKDKSYALNNHNSLSFETVIHHIPNLSERFIYFNDDFFIGRYIPYTYFFNEKGTHIRWNKRIIDAYEMDNYNGLTSTYSKWKLKSYPDTMNKRVRGYLEHHPRPLIKSYYFELETVYSQWFDFIRSHKQRYDSCLIRIPGINTDAVESESLHLHIMAKMISDQANNGLNIEIVDHLYSKETVIHYWAFSKYNLEPHLLKKIVDEITCLKPVTFCVNDNFDPNRHSKLYKEQSRIMSQFHEKYYKNMIAPWENGYVYSLTSSPIVKTVDVAVVNHDFCIRRKSCYIW